MLNLVLTAARVATPIILRQLFGSATRATLTLGAMHKATDGVSTDVLLNTAESSLSTGGKILGMTNAAPVVMGSVVDTGRYVFSGVNDMGSSIVHRFTESARDKVRDLLDDVPPHLNRTADRARMALNIDRRTSSGQASPALSSNLGPTFQQAHDGKQADKDEKTFVLMTLLAAASALRWIGETTNLKLVSDIGNGLEKFGMMLQTNALVAQGDSWTAPLGLDPADSAPHFRPPAQIFQPRGMVPG